MISILYCRKGVNLVILDIVRLFLFYYVVLNNYEEVVKVILEFFFIVYWVKFEIYKEM